VTHNIFKSDVFSVGLIFYQCAAMEDVTGFNQRNQVNDGEKLIEASLKKLKTRYSDHIIEIIRLMLKFEECDRPSFIELSKLVLTSTENTIETPNANKSTQQKAQPAQKVPIEAKKVAKTFSTGGPKDQEQLHDNAMPPEV